MKICATLLLAFSWLLVACGEDGSGPFIAAVEPAAAARGAEIELVGKRFCGDEADRADDNGVCTTPPSGLVNLGTDANVVRATVRSWTDTSITVEVPQSAPVGATLVVVTVNGAASNAVDFEVQ